MKIVCKYNNLEDIRKHAEKKSIAEEFIVIGKQYNVYGVQFHLRDKTRYCILEESFDNISPYPLAADLFTVLDNRLSCYWEFYPIDDNNKIIGCDLVYPEWNEDPLHFENLIDGDPEAEKIFAKYKKLMDEEFEDVEIPQYPIV